MLHVEFTRFSSLHKILDIIVYKIKCIPLQIQTVIIQYGKLSSYWKCSFKDVSKVTALLYLGRFLYPKSQSLLEYNKQLMFLAESCEFEVENVFQTVFVWTKEKILKSVRET